MTEINSFSDTGHEAPGGHVSEPDSVTSESNRPASGLDTGSVNSQEDRSTGPDASVNLIPSTVNSDTGISPEGRGNSVIVREDPGIDAAEMARFFGMVFGRTKNPIEICAFLQGQRTPVPVFVTLDGETVTNKGETLILGKDETARMIADADGRGLLVPWRTGDVTPYPVDAWYVRMTTLAHLPDTPGRPAERGGATNVCEFLGFWLDGDYDVPRHHQRGENTEKLPLPKTEAEVRAIWKRAGYPEPSVVWNSGGGINGFWALPEPLVIPEGEEGADLYRRLKDASDRWQKRAVHAAASMGLHHDSVKNLDRLMRLPGSVNRKDATHPKAVYAEYTGAAYSLDELLALIPEPVTQDDGSTWDPVTGDQLTPARPKRRNRASGSTDSDSTGLTPWDHYDQEMWNSGGFRTMLVSDGWQEHGWRGQTLDLTHPNKDVSQGNSATLGHNDGTGALGYGAKLWNFSDNAPGLLGTTFKDRFLTPSQYWAVTRHNGDFSASASDLYAQGFGDRHTVTDDISAWGEPPAEEDRMFTADDVLAIPGQRQPTPIEVAPEPIPLFAPEATPYDMTRFGRMGAIAQAFADGLGVSPDMTIVGMLSAASTACGGRAYVYVEERDWKQPVIFHGINLAPPGGQKSDAGKICWKPVMELQKERRDSSRTKAEMDAMFLDICDSRIDKLKKDAVRVTNPGDRQQIEADLAAEVRRRNELEENQTAPCRLWANDTTPEALIENMARQNGRMAILDTEPRFLKIMAGGAGRKGGNPDPSVMLAGYDQDAGSRDRITNRTEVILEKPSLTIGIFTQPKRFASIAADNIEMDEGGAWGRFFFSVPTGTRFRSRAIDRVSSAVTDEHEARIRAMFRELYDAPDDVVVTLTPEAEELFLAHWLNKDPELLTQEERVRIDGWDAKEEGRALRIATLMELYEDPQSREIGIDRIRDVIAISETMRTHARSASEHIATMEGNPLAPAREVLEWLRQETPEGTVKAGAALRGLTRKRSKTVARMDHILDALKVLEDYGWVKPALIDDWGKGDLRFFVPHPVVRSPLAPGAPTVTTSAGASGDPVPEPEPEPAEEPKSKAQTLADDVWTTVVGYCDTQADDGGPAPGDWRVKAVELYELLCHMTDRIPVDDMTPDQKAAVPEEKRVDKIRFGTALKEKFPDVGKHRSGKGAGKILWYTGIRFKSDR